MTKQRTIKSPVTLQGVGLHTGENVTLTLRPAKTDHGIKFKRVDLEDKPIIPATADLVRSTNRSTTLVGRENVTITTIEHLMAATVGTGVDNLLIELDGAEVPILDGSSKPFVEAIFSAGIAEQDADREVFVIEKPIYYKDAASGSEIVIVPSEKYELSVTIDFNSTVIGRQSVHLADIEAFSSEIAPCRTFVFLKELAFLASQGLIKGGQLDNAIVIADQLMPQAELDQLAMRLGRSSVSVEKEGILNNTSLQFPDEPGRHKLLDLIGDLALSGVRFEGKVIAYKPGHGINTKVARMIKEAHLQAKKMRGIPHYDPTQPPLKNTIEVEMMLPHRHPFLLVDKIIELTDRHVVGIKNVTYDEYFFRGHFPNNPVMPGVLQIEALAQTGGILALSTVPDPGNWDTYFVKIDKTKFKHKVVPGDTLILRMELLSPIRRGICQMYGTAYVGDKIVSEGELTAQIVRRS